MNNNETSWWKKLYIPGTTVLIDGHPYEVKEVAYALGEGDDEITLRAPCCEITFEVNDPFIHAFEHRIEFL